jgi:hypothetical protein
MPYLVRIELAENSLRGSLPPYDLPALHDLALSSNQLSGELSRDLVRLKTPALTSLYLAFNQFT